MGKCGSTIHNLQDQRSRKTPQEIDGAEEVLLKGNCGSSLNKIGKPAIHKIDGEERLRKRSTVRKKNFVKEIVEVV